jgi:hypothetical protein
LTPFAWILVLGVAFGIAGLITGSVVFWFLMAGALLLAIGAGNWGAKQPPGPAP